MKKPSKKEMDSFELPLSAYINILEPDFEKRSKIHDWRNYVPYELKGNWDKLTLRERKIIAFICEERANSEEWD